jgi:hypothetical protein
LNTGKVILENAEDVEVFDEKAYIDELWGYDLQLDYFWLQTHFKERAKNQLPLDDGKCAWNAMIFI